MHIEVVISQLSGLNIMTPESCNEVCNVLKNHYAQVGTTVIKEKSDLENLIHKKPDLVFSGVKYIGFTKGALHRESPDKIWLAEYLDSKGINFTGSKVEALKLEFDKRLAKQKMQENNVNTAPFFIAEPGQYKSAEELPVPFPLFIKPIYEGGGKGVDKQSLVKNFTEFEEKVESIFQKFKSPSLVEKYLNGREFTVGIFDTESEEDRTAMPVELITNADKSGDRILSFEIKKEDNERLIAIKDPEEHKRISAFSKKAFAVLGARDYGRIDVRMDENGVLYFLEANLLPGLNPIKSYFIKTCKKNTQLDYENIILKIVEAGMKRNIN